jgi:hypothetical protein
MVCGVSHPRARFTEEQVRAIRASAKPLALIAHDHGVTVSAIRHIKQRRSWKHVV